VKRTGVEKKDKRVEGAEGESKRRGKSCEAHNVTSKSSMDENRPGESRHP